MSNLVSKWKRGCLEAYVRRVIGKLAPFIALLVAYVLAVLKQFFLDGGLVDAVLVGLEWESVDTRPDAIVWTAHVRRELVRARVVHLAHLAVLHLQDELGVPFDVVLELRVLDAQLFNLLGLHCF